MSTRFPAVAGSFYPANPVELNRDLQQMLYDAPTPKIEPKALIVPHAGYIYSGPIAAAAYNSIKSKAKKITRVVLLGPSHRAAFRGIATPGHDIFQTPLGDITIDQKAIKELGNLPCITELKEAHFLEHSLEVHLPFLQQILPNFTLVPLVVGEASADEVASVLERLWGGEETLIVISSDLSHYHPYQEAKQIDLRTTLAIEAFDCHIHSEQACGCRPINGLLSAAKNHALKLTTLDVRNSGDTAGDKDQVVGYGAYALH